MTSILKTKTTDYPNNPPFHPSENYPEYLFSESDILKAGNDVYADIRNIFILSGLDKTNIGTNDWNPLKDYVQPGDKVVIKPNLVRHFHSRKFSLDCVVTHGSIIRTILDYSLIALKEKGEIIVGDAPLQYADFDAIIVNNGLKEVIDFIKKNTEVKVQLVDFRYEKSEKDTFGKISVRERRYNDFENHTCVNLGEQSHLSEIADKYERFRVTNYNPTNAEAP